MSLRTRSWDKLFALTRAKAGSGFNSADTASVSVLLNAAARTLSDYSPYWPRLLELQPRSVDSTGVIAMSEDSYEVKGAGTTETNGLYVENGDNDSVTAYTATNGENVYSLYRSTTWFIATGQPDSGGTVLYTNSSSADTPPTTGWVASSGEAPIPTVSVLEDIDEPIAIWSGPKWQGSDQFRDATPILDKRWYVSASGIQLTRPEGDVAYVGFKRDLTDEYGDGTNGTVSDVPTEWFDYMAYHAARSLQDAHRSGADFSGIALRQIDELRDSQLLKLNRANAMQVLKNYFDTYYNYDMSVR